MPDKDVIKGKAKHAEGHMQAAFGDMTNNPDQKAKGQVKKVQGKAQEATGHLKDAFRAASHDTSKH
ncbi:MAG TPA: CsbD family protein [Capsulimonadaceae bacterium]|jgi:uncharacterized protein YjbJ (UPF0337 family)